MASGKLYTYPDNFRADKIRAVAQISGFKLQVSPTILVDPNFMR